MPYGAFVKLEPGIKHGRADRADPCRNHAHVRIDEGKHSGAMVKRADNDAGQVMPGRHAPQALSKGEKLAGIERIEERDLGNGNGGNGDHGDPGSEAPAAEDLPPEAPPPTVH